jgi:hypothetical protein
MTEIEGLNVEAWEQWVAYRKRIKKPLRVDNYPWTQRKLAKFGKNQMAAVDQSMENEWQGLFPPRECDTLAVDPTEPW